MNFITAITSKQVSEDENICGTIIDENVSVCVRENIKVQ
jgi:hypothetical protein